MKRENNMKNEYVIALKWTFLALAYMAVSLVIITAFAGWLAGY
jgi:hypothetical protein